MAVHPPHCWIPRINGITKTPAPDRYILEPVHRQLYKNLCGKRTDNGRAEDASVLADVLVDEVALMVRGEVGRVAVVENGEGVGGAVDGVARLREVILNLILAALALESTPAVVVAAPER